jgi:hypothetical protein
MEQQGYQLRSRGVNRTAGISAEEQECKPEQQRQQL